MRRMRMYLFNGLCAGLSRLYLHADSVLHKISYTPIKGFMLRLGEARRVAAAAARVVL